MLRKFRYFPGESKKLLIYVLITLFEGNLRLETVLSTILGNRFNYDTWKKWRDDNFLGIIFVRDTTFYDVYNNKRNRPLIVISRNGDNYETI